MDGKMAAYFGRRLVTACARFLSRAGGTEDDYEDARSEIMELCPEWFAGRDSEYDAAIEGCYATESVPVIRSAKIAVRRMATFDDVVELQRRGLLGVDDVAYAFKNM